MDKITIIMPIYNSQEYLKQAIDSVIYQTYKNLEIILVDDGSTDLSGKICDEYEKKDDRIKVFHQVNKGNSAARNVGLDNATGKYIMFIDSDDQYEENSCEIMYNEIKDKNADYVIGNYINTDEDGTKWNSPVFSIEKYNAFKVSIKDYEKSIYIMNSSVCNKIFSKEFIDKINIRFIEGVRSEDAIFTTKCFINSENVYYIPQIIYQYRQRYKSSVSNTCSKNFFEQTSKAYNIIYNNFKEGNQLEFYRYFYARSVKYILYKFIDSCFLEEQEKYDILKELSWFYKLNDELKVTFNSKAITYFIESIVNKDYKQALKYCEILAEIRGILPDEIKEQMVKSKI